MINKEEFRDSLSLIAQLKKNINTERRRIKSSIESIKSIEEELNLRRDALSGFERILIDKCDELFKLVYQQLPNGEDDE